MIESVGTTDLPPSAPDLRETRAALAAEWQTADPRTPSDIARFYQGSRCLAADLAAWHAHPQRQAWTEMIVHVAKESGARTIIDIGCGSGHDLIALRKANRAFQLHGVEPNTRLRDAIPYNVPYGLYADLEHDGPGGDRCPIEDADLLICIDVLEHVPDPESFLGGIAIRAKLGCLLFETTATHDTGTPLHLKENRGWHPGRVLERHGWDVIDRSGRVRVWRRTEHAGRQRASLLLCAYRSVNAEMMTSLLALCAGNEIGWRLRCKTGDALISRSRAIVVTRWWHETADDVFLMVDDDIVFTPADADRLVELCRNGHDIICGAYPVHDGGHLACRFYPGTGAVHFGPGTPPVRIEYAATGFLAVHRKVIDALIADLPLCHGDQSWGFYPLFQPMLKEHPTAGHEWLSEDWGFIETARQHGFPCWVDPQTKLTHIGHAGINVHNMAAIHSALQGGRDG